MSHFTEYQVRSFTFLFEQYAIDLSVNGLRTEHQFKDASTPEFPLISRLPVSELAALLKRVGPAVTPETAKEMLYKYDSSCTGCLGFEDFLELLADYQDTLLNRRNEAMEYYEDMQNSVEYEAGQFLSSFPCVENYVAHLGLDDPEEFFTAEEPLTDRIISQGSVTDMNLLKRQIVVRIFNALNIRHYARFKKREGRSVEYQALDPIIRVSCTGITKETTVMVGSTKPEWDQDLIFNIFIPPGEIHDVQNWIEKQNITFYLYDYDSSGLVPHAELLAFGSIALSRVLLATHKPFTTIVKMASPDCALSEKDIPRLDVSITDATLEDWSWTKVEDAYPHPEQVWDKLYGPKLKRDLETHASTSADAKKKKTIDEDEDDYTIWNHYTTLMQSIRGFFKRRSFNAIALDELNTFRLLPALLRPLVLQDPRIESQADLCMAISSIPFKNRELTVSEKTKHLLFVHQYEQREGFDSSPSSYVASWKVKANPAEMISESFYAQFASPSAMISRREGTLMEHAMAFCSMLLGIGVNAYVAIGRIKKRRYIWVIVIHVKKIDEQEKRKTRYADTDEDVAVDLSQLDFVSYESAGKKYVFKKKRFALLSLVDEVNAKNSKLVVTHYDIATGNAFQVQKNVKFPFDRLMTLFNHKNIWFNVQQTDAILHPLFCWDLSNDDDWFPFLNKKTPIVSGSIQCFYQNPHNIHQFEYKLDYFRMDEFSMLKTLVDWIQLYRQHHLYISDTYFHRDICRAIQSYMVQMDSSGGASKKKSLYASTGSTNFVASQMTFIGDGSFENSGTESGTVRRIQDKIVHLLPDHHYWQGALFQFSDSSVSGIMEQLILSGFLDCTIPHAMYTIGGKVTKQPFGMTSVRVVVGYVADIIGRDLAK